MFRRWGLRCLTLGLLLLPGCGKFFLGSGAGGTNTACSNCIYVANFGAASIGAYGISSTGLSLVTGSPFNLGTFTTNTIVADPQFPYLYAGSAAGGVVVGFTINSDGTLSGLSYNGSSTIAQAAAQAMTFDSTGSYLYILLSSAISGFGFIVQPIDTTTGLPSTTVSPQVITLPNGIITSPTILASTQSIVASPDGKYLFISTGTGGVIAYTLAGGLVNTAISPVFLSNGCNGVGGAYNTCYGMAVDPTSKYLLVAESGPNTPGLAVFSILSGGGLKQVGSNYTTGTGPNAVLIDQTGTYVYVANGGVSGGNSITGYPLAAVETNSNVKQLSGSPYSTSTATNAGGFNGLNTIGLAEDTTGTYVIAINNSGSPDLQLYTISASGSLTATGSVTSTANTSTTAQPASVTTAATSGTSM
jgi:6-phosphogluconolactonase (cycloisomerase 2 family)